MLGSRHLRWSRVGSLELDFSVLIISASYIVKPAMNGKKFPSISQPFWKTKPIEKGLIFQFQ